MSQELKTAVEELTSTVVGLKTAVLEAKEQFKSDVPSDVQDRLEKIATDVVSMSETVRKIDEAPALKRAFDMDEQIETKRMSFERKAKLPSSVTGDEDMHELFEAQDALEVMRFLKRFDPTFNEESTKSYQKIQEIKATYVGTAGTGLEWIPTGYSPDLILKYEMERQVASLFTEISMPYDPFKVPAQTGRARAYIKGRAANATQSESTTDNITLSCTTLAGYSKAAYEVEEDAIMAMVPFIRMDLAQSLAEAEEDAIINGDTSGTHQDSDVTGANDARKAWKGLRKLASAASATYDMGSPSTAKLRKLRGLMGKYAVNPSRLATVVSAVGLIHLLGLSEVMTLEKYGPQATVITGELGRFDGSPIIPSGLMREDLNASGVYDGSTKTKTGILLVNRSAFMLGRRRDVMIESFRDIVAGADEIVASMRKDFQCRYASTQKVLAYGYNVPNEISVS
jgi:HK97 family phage major capsid protein